MDVSKPKSLPQKFKIKLSEKRDEARFTRTTKIAESEIKLKGILNLSAFRLLIDQINKITYVTKNKINVFSENESMILEDTNITGNKNTNDIISNSVTDFLSLTVFSVLFAAFIVFSISS